MNELIVDEIKQVSGGCSDCCKYHLNFTVTTTSSATAGVANLVAELFNGDITNITTFLNELNYAAAHGTDFSEIRISDLVLIPG